MSTSYKTSPLIAFNSILAAAPFNGVSVVNDKEDHQPCLTDGKNFLRIYRGGDGKAYFERYGANDVEGIMSALSDKFGVTFISEHDENEEASLKH